MGRAKGAILIGLIAVALAAVFFQSELGSWLSTHLQSTSHLEEIGQVAQRSGSVEVRAFKAGDFVPVDQVDSKLRVGDNLRTGSQSVARINFLNGFAIEVREGSQLFFEQQVQTGALIVHILRGDFSVLQAGTPGQLLVLENGFLKEPSGRFPQKPMRIQIDNIQIPAPDEPSAPLPPPSEQAATLTTEYIMSIIQGQKSFFNRCYADHLQTSPNSKGQMNFTFTIQPSGDVSDVKLLNSTIEDATLQSCVATVLQRCRFQPFQSEPIVANYPIVFE